MSTARFLCVEKEVRHSSTCAHHLGCGEDSCITYERFADALLVRGASWLVSPQISLMSPPHTSRSVEDNELHFLEKGFNERAMVAADASKILNFFKIINFD